MIETSEVSKKYGNLGGLMRAEGAPGSAGVSPASLPENAGVSAEG